jgi:electron transfer flavoprotein alpha subunit
MDWNLASPALMATAREGLVCVTALDKTERRSRLLSFGRDETVVVTMRPGVAEPIPQDSNRQGEHRALQGDSQSEAIEGLELVPPDTRTVDIRHSERLVSGGRGVGGKEGFEALWRFADNINSAVSASRMAVDLGWIDRERQVGQTGRTVKPELYIACGISGASHHLAGMSESTHIVAVNTDAEAPIFKTAHLGIAADLHEVLDEAGKMLA